MFWQCFRVSTQAVGQIFLLGAVGYFLVKKGILKEEGLNSLSRLVIEITLPVLIFYQLVRNFSFTSYPQWWVFPLLSAGITFAALLMGLPFIQFIDGRQRQMQFLSLVGFQNSGYIPLALIAELMPQDKAAPMFIYLFLFLLGFNLLVWSLGVYLLSSHTARRFELGSLFSPPAIACLISLLVVFFRLQQFIPQVFFKPMQMVGESTLPLALFVVGGSLAQVKVRQMQLKENLLLILAKLILLPGCGLWLLIQFRLPPLPGLLLLMELAVPSATSLTVIARHYQREDLLISQGVFFTHIASLLTLPVFLSLYYALVMV